MPIRFLSLPEKLQYAIHLMEVNDLIAFSLCSKRTKNLVKFTVRKLHPIVAYVYENCIRFKIIARNSHHRIFPDVFDSYIKLVGVNGTGDWRKHEIPRSEWIAHFMSIFNISTIHYLYIETVSPSCVDTVKQFFPKCEKLYISRECSREFTKIAFLELFPITEQVEIYKNIFDDENDISKSLTLNLSSLSVEDQRNPLELKLDDLLILNIANLRIDVANISEKELNRFLKSWKKGNHAFYRPKVISLVLEDGAQINCEKIFKGVKYEDNDGFYQFQLIRRDGKKLKVFIADNYIALKFK
ncbi:unnamed protein product [Caenorhabditis nigoni]